MGCVNSSARKKRRVAPNDSEIFSSVRAVIDQCPTVVDEASSIVLRYRTPYFRAHAQVLFPPIHNKDVWTIGWIQGCDHMTFINQYGNLGNSSWEIPALKNGKYSIVSDSDGISYPWYGNSTEISTIVGPTETYTRHELSMNDNFYPSVTWDIPVSEGTKSYLTHIVRDQSFFTWLAAINETTEKIVILSTVRWTFHLEIDIDPTRELGQRTTLITPRFQKQPQIFHEFRDKKHSSRTNPNPFQLANKNNHNKMGNPIPMSALVRPSANYAQTLIWRPTVGCPIVIVAAREKHRDKNTLVLYDNLGTDKYEQTQQSPNHGSLRALSDDSNDSDDEL